MTAYSLDRWTFLGSAPIGMPCLCNVPTTVFVTSGLYESKSNTFLTTLTRPSLGNFCNHNRNSIISNSFLSHYNSVHVQCTAAMTRLQPIRNDQNISDLKSGKCAPSSYPSSFMLARHGTKNRITEEDQSRGYEMLPPRFAHFIQRPHHK